MAASGATFSASVATKPVGKSRTKDGQMTGPRRVSVADLHPHPENPRRIAKERLEQLKRSLEADPGMLEARPLIALPDGTVIAGNQRLRAVKELGWPDVPVVTADLDETTARLWMLRDNNAFGDWDERPLAEMLAALDGGGVDLALAGFDSPTVDELLKGLEASGERAEPPEPGPVPREPRTNRGELIELGRHRLLCGDATSDAQMALLLEGQPADLVFTDPPYGVEYQVKMTVAEARKRRRRVDLKEVPGDDLGRGVRPLLDAAFATAHEALKPGGAFYVCSPSGDMELQFRLALEGADLPLRAEIVWVKDRLVLGRSDYHWRHETLLYGWKNGAGHYFVADRTQDTVWEIPRPSASAEHPTIKPLELVERAVANSTQRGERVLDQFAGAGTTLFAAEKLGRRAFLMEIDPGYCDVIRDRWERWHAG